ncbi:lipid-A-disaccharide synthase N-terminal domain-containing protein [Acuticoccus sp. M5D2P5]|uniref:lipid-A-disaccharide synthase N-terminal domain-containing protein n=1 Tax=Acuticoccus kalidii TaxID=2910977 RepID=UPI001F461548|nr:lipid-A-disaccharide synthase N-terminal domain-containing protein [Acuticoccus kalidii]MCF3936549.1 lipid-A-disaccharide synthase N-terminal domain-containing protein [Acuticoccus kalidii]
MSNLVADVANWFHAVFVEQFDVWIAIGFFAQAMFSARFIIQWLASEKAGRSVVPVAFWFFSIAGGAILFVYALYRQDPVFIAGQGAGILIYARNLWLIFRERRSALAETA